MHSSSIRTTISRRQMLMILQFIPVISSISWYTTAIPLIFVLAVSAAKDGYDDVQRHISDRQVNNRKSYVVRGGRLVEEPWHNVKVGDVIRMMSNQFVAIKLALSMGKSFARHRTINWIDFKGN
ncbi:unnamed protein product, partial [Mesorhabditis belari]|uniref:P-type ATPase N-terminal domain-containing protein n=1 Tax=Mesorhabditis belari TaxID=2138241 RepID=A0AAF3FQC8_9BILA